MVKTRLGLKQHKDGGARESKRGGKAASDPAEGGCDKSSWPIDRAESVLDCPTTSTTIASLQESIDRES